MLSYLFVRRPPIPKDSDRSFQYASPHWWNKLPVLLREPVLPLYADVTYPVLPAFFTHQLFTLSLYTQYLPFWYFSPL